MRLLSLSHGLKSHRALASRVRQALWSASCLPSSITVSKKPKPNLNLISCMAPTRKRTKLEQARQYLAGGAIFREDSDDELGYEDHPWEWIYEDVDTTEQAATPKKRKREAAATSASTGKRIVGARMGSFTCKLGDTVLLKADGSQAWVGIICELWDSQDEDGEDEKMAKFLWFCSEKEIRNKSNKRTDFLPVRIIQHLLLVYEMMCRIP
jgi:hypothetical protein